MERATIDFGIDLGTTNSSIAVLKGTMTEVFRNNEGQELTPSAVWIDDKGRLYVGSRAKERYMYDEENARIEFKLQMGTSHTFPFAASSRKMTAEELSAEILKSLRGDVKQYTGEEVIAAAISVPAAFELPQCEATNKAAQLAGLSSSPLIQEPVAAALAYSFQSESDRIFWLVYDFGGGTFDAAIIQVREGLIQVVNHGGDNRLGGRLIDEEIVDQLLVPAVKQVYALSDFRRGNDDWIAAFAKLKLHAEKAKIHLSRDSVTQIIIDELCEDEHGGSLRFEHELKHSDIEPLIEPRVERSINICKKVLKEARLSPGDIEKVILVGGPTLTPILREILSDRLGIPLEFHMDPLTVVARGAAIFAGTQLIPEAIRLQRPLVAGQYRLELEYDPIGSELEPLVGGRVVASEGASLAAFTIEFVQSKSKWRSGRVDVAANGAFMATVYAEKGRSNEFSIELRDAAGNLRETVPDRFTYTTGISISAQTLIHSVGVALANNEMQPFFGKGTPLPVRRREIHHTTVALKRGESGTFLRIPVVEGENIRRADRNPLIGALEVSGEGIQRDVPVGSEVEITIDIDESRLVLTKAYLPILDEEYEHVVTLGYVDADPKRLADEFVVEKARLEEASEKARKTGAPQALEPLQRIESDRMLHDIEASLAAAPIDENAAGDCQQRLLGLRSAIDEVEDIVEWPDLVSRAEEAIEWSRDIVDKLGDKDAQRNFSSLESETRKAIASRDADLLRRKIEEVYDLGISIWSSHPSYWIEFFRHLAEERKPHMRDQALAEQFIVQGRRAIDADDLKVLVAVVRQLYDLLPPDEQQAARGYGGTTMPHKWLQG